MSEVDDFIKELQPSGVSLITLHWTVGSYNQIFQDDYHFQIRGDGAIWVDPRAFDEHGNFVPLAHAWHHNSRNIGISLCAMFNATETVGYNPEEPLGSNPPASYGQYPPTQAQYASMCKLASALVRRYGLTFDKIYTHYDLAQLDGYPGERWEFKYEKPLILKEVQKVYEETKPTT